MNNENNAVTRMVEAVATAVDVTGESLNEWARIAGYENTVDFVSSFQANSTDTIVKLLTGLKRISDTPVDLTDGTTKELADKYCGVVEAMNKLSSVVNESEIMTHLRQSCRAVGMSDSEIAGVSATLAHLSNNEGSEIMPKNFKTTKDLKNYLQKAINTSLRKEVSEATKEALSESVEEHVYSIYTPKSYDRRGSDGGGLGDVRNYKAELVEDGHIRVTNDTPPNPDWEHGSFSRPFIDRAVEEGKGYFVCNPGARPFIQPAVEKMREDGTHVSALMAGLKAQGIKVKKG